MDQGLLIGLRALSIMVAGIAGWLLSRSVPSWRIDRFNESFLDGEFSEDDLDCLIDDTTIPCSSNVGTSWIQETWLPVAFFLAAVALGIFGWGEETALSREQLNTYYGFSLLITRGFLVSIAGGALGYLTGVLTDKGPVGPLD